jgi:hypothetical protein
VETIAFFEFDCEYCELGFAKGLDDDGRFPDARKTMDSTVDRAGPPRLLRAALSMSTWRSENDSFYGKRRRDGSFWVSGYWYVVRRQSPSACR